MAAPDRQYSVEYAHLGPLAAAKIHWGKGVAGQLNAVEPEGRDVLAQVQGRTPIIALNDKLDLRFGMGAPGGHVECQPGGDSFDIGRHNNPTIEPNRRRGHRGVHRHSLAVSPRAYPHGMSLIATHVSVEAHLGYELPVPVIFES
ncbi:MAG TPA: hypothetical protein VLL25_03135 [Acidimicrobiales bacterium]|nr:hypothetical protein [Acidimicrobiales bacterium]